MSNQEDITKPNLVEQSNQISEPNIETPGSPIRSKWSIPESQPSPKVQIPIRSVSTFSFKEAISQLPPRPHCAAPFPTLPTRREVQEMKAQVDADIQRYHAELYSLQHERNALLHMGAQLIPEKSEFQIHEYRGLLITDFQIDTVIADNRSKKAISHNSASLKRNILPSKFRHIYELPHFKDIIQEERRNLPAMLSLKFASKRVEIEKAQALAHAYLKARDLWIQRCPAIQEYGLHTDEINERWPNEFPKYSEIDDELRLKWVAPDSRMYLCKRDMQDRCYYNMNGYVEDPVREHNAFRNRICWTEHEVKVFLDKYHQSPKDFRKIADSLPEKNIKDVIEFYYRNRYELCLSDTETAPKKRSTKKKVITEGSGKKTY